MPSELVPTSATSSITVAFSYWKLACIVQGVYARYLHGQKEIDQADFHLFPKRIGHTLQLAVEMAERLPS